MSKSTLEISPGDLIRVSYESSVKSWGNYWKNYGMGIPAAIPNTRISEEDDDMRIAYIPDGTTLPVLGIKTIEEEGFFFSRVRSKRTTSLGRGLIRRKYQPELKETQ
ncbi:MAG: hypothetical protein E6R04_07700 [Spirochaetes bacterium]|nr:MAG: hypothetical protein E6R04_07700 [Spirochaetota bacterium]